MTRHARLDRRPLPRARAREGPRRALQGLRRRPAADRARLRLAHGDRLDRARHRSSRCSRASGRRSARRGCRRSRPCAKARSCRRRGSRASARSSRSSSAACRSPLVLYSVFGHGMTTGNRLILLGVGVLGLFVGVAMVAPLLVRPLASVLGRPATADRRRRRRARALELDAQPEPHGLDRRRADDRARARDDRRGARAGAQGAVRERGQQRVPRRLRPDLAERLHADVDRLGRGAARVRRRDRRRRRARRRRPRRRQDDPGRGRRPGDLEGAQAQLEGTARTRRSRRSGCTGAIVDKSYAKKHHLVVGSPIRLETPGGKFLDLRVHGDRRAAARRLAARHGHDLVAGVRLGLPEPAERLHLRQHAGRRHAGEHREAERGAQRLSRTRRSRPSSSSSRTRSRGSTSS